MLTSTSVVLNLFAEGKQNQPKDFVRELKTNKYLTLAQVNWHVCFYAERILFHKPSEVLGCWEPHKGCGSQNRCRETLVKIDSYQYRNNTIVFFAMQ